MFSTLTYRKPSHGIRKWKSGCLLLLGIGYDKNYQQLFDNHFDSDYQQKKWNFRFNQKTSILFCLYNNRNQWLENYQNQSISEVKADFLLITYQ
eukprot:snap_masked-scaffold_22-processed-gene-2.2-mRNA-1 protein AED:1.00 eAED:1.00 QI:0/0/0/0/1/1/2/0/93